MIEIHIEPYGKPLSDWEIKKTVEDIVYGHTPHKENNGVYRFSNNTVLTAFRAELIESPVYQKDFKFFVNGVEVKFNDYMAADDYLVDLKTLCELTSEFSDRYTKAAINLKSLKDKAAKYADQVERLKSSTLTTEELMAKLLEMNGKDYILTLKTFRDVTGISLKESLDLLHEGQANATPKG